MVLTYITSCQIMDKSRLEQLIDKYLQHTADPAEQEELNNWYRTFTGEDDPAPLSPAQEERLGQEMLTFLQSHIRRKKPQPVLLYIGLAAACVAAALFFIRPLLDSHPSNNTLVANIPAASSENRFIYLPDSSKVLLHPGSKFDYRLNGNNREVTLQGEAYFDIASHPDQPFIIHTGEVTSTVLGTSLNIKAWSTDSITVSVITGKVQVSNAKATTILTPNQQVVFDQHHNNTQQLKILPAAVIAWAKSDMQFQDIPYDQLAQHLGRRYNVSFEFKNPALKNCPITGRFTGTETLNEVLDVLSQTMGTTYTINGRTVELDGKACFN